MSLTKPEVQEFLDWVADEFDQMNLPGIERNKLIKKWQPKAGGWMAFDGDLLTLKRYVLSALHPAEHIDTNHPLDTNDQQPEQSQSTLPEQNITYVMVTTRALAHLVVNNRPFDLELSNLSTTDDVAKVLALLSNVINRLEEKSAQFSVLPHFGTLSTPATSAPSNASGSDEKIDRVEKVMQKGTNFVCLKANPGKAGEDYAIVTCRVPGDKQKLAEALGMESIDEFDEDKIYKPKSLYCVWKQGKANEGGKGFFHDLVRFEVR